MGASTHRIASQRLATLRIPREFEGLLCVGLHRLASVRRVWSGASALVLHAVVVSVVARITVGKRIKPISIFVHAERECRWENFAIEFPRHHAHIALKHGEILAVDRDFARWFAAGAASWARGRIHNYTYSADESLFFDARPFRRPKRSDVNRE